MVLMGFWLVLRQVFVALKMDGFAALAMTAA